jgi:hypothetical protein
MVFAMTTVSPLRASARVAGRARASGSAAAVAGAVPRCAMRPTRAVRVAGLGTSSPRGLALRSPRGALVAASAKKGKKSAPEPVYEDDEDDEDDEETGWDDDEDVDDDEETEIGSASAADGEEDEEEEDEETGDASELMPPKSTGSVSSKKSGKKKKSKSLVVEEEETGNAFGTAVGYVQDAVANPAIRNLGILGFSILAGSFALSAYNVFMRYNSNKSKRKRQVNKNVVVVERLRDFFPENRDSLNRGHIRGLQGKTGFKPEEIFRKYARYKLNEEPFTNDFVADVLALKQACELDGETVKQVLIETGERIVKKYGILMRDVSEMGASGAARKVDGCGMFAKVMYLADLEEFVPREKGAEAQQKLKEIFGATDEDYEKLRIVALGSGADDVSVLNAMITEKSAEGEENAE